VGYGLLVVSFIGPLVTYILMRNARVTSEQKVLTPAHLKLWFKNLGSGRKRKKRSDTLAAHEQGPPVTLIPCGGSDAENQSHLIMARQSPGYVPVKELIADAIVRRVARIMLDFTKEAVAVRYDIDGVWHSVEPRDRETGDVMLAVMKKIAALNMEERRARQEGEFRTKFVQGRTTLKFNCHLVSQGTKTGERAVIDLAPDKMPFSSLADLGMREKIREELKELLGAQTGFFLFSAIPVGGLRTCWHIGLTATDRYLRDFLGIEDAANPCTHVENVEIFKFGETSEDTPPAVLRKVLLREPDVVVVPEIVDGAMLNTLCDYVLQERKLVIASLRAKDGVEGLLRVLSLGGESRKFAETVTGIINQRLVRVLCTGCRQAYEPPQELLEKLGIPPGRVQVLYREYQPPPPDAKKRKGEPEICPECGGIGYRGRTGIFELIKISDDMRSALAENPRPEALRQLARKAGNVSLQEEGVLLVARGVTSLNELQRVLKQ
jgi:type II secretory ATPase GspE/PulE/Tfp pilus assembly ATPase PilB-like protein